MATSNALLIKGPLNFNVCYLALRASVNFCDIDWFRPQKIYSLNVMQPELWLLIFFPSALTLHWPLAIHFNFISFSSNLSFSSWLLFLQPVCFDWDWTILKYSPTKNRWLATRLSQTKYYHDTKFLLLDNPTINTRFCIALGMSITYLGEKLELRYS